MAPGRSTRRAQGRDSTQAEQAPGSASQNPELAQAEQVGNAAMAERIRGGEGPEGAPDLGAGRPLDGALAGRLGASFGSDVSGVMVHTGPEAAKVAADAGAEAVSIGQHIAFAAGRYQPGTVEGDALIAHEVAHSVQQPGVQQPGVQQPGVQQPGAQQQGAAGSEGKALAGPGGGHDAFEQDADAAAGIALARQHGIDVSEALGESSEEKRAPSSRSALAMRACKRSSGPTPALMKKLGTELTDVIGRGLWDPTLRTVLHQKHHPPIEQRHDDRNAGTEPDLTGLGTIAGTGRMAAGVKAMGPAWGGLSADERTSQLVALADAELQVAKVPPFMDSAHEDITPRAQFNRGEWKITIQDATVNATTLDDTLGAQLAGTVLHEARHAEQAFLSGRYMAGQRKTQGDIQRELFLPGPVAAAAFAAPLTAGAPEFALAQEMHQAFTTDIGAHAATTQAATEAIEKLKRDRVAAQAALNALIKSPGQGSYDAGVVARDKLEAQIRTVDAAYAAYRAIPYEADAHEVGISTELTYGKLP